MDKPKWYRKFLIVLLIVIFSPLIIVGIVIGTIAPGATEFIGTGLAMEIPMGYAGFVYARSGLSCKEGLAPANKVGVVDADYRGEITVALYNHSNEAKTVEPGDRIAQMVIAPFLKVDFTEVGELSKTVRGVGGFGSTGNK